MAEGRKYAKDPDVEDIRRDIKGLNIEMEPEQGFRKFSKYRTGASYVMFEGAQGEKPTVQFAPYSGVCQGYHKTRRLYEPKLMKSDAKSSNAKEESQLKEVFCTQMDLIKRAYKESEHGELSVTARFGSFYMFDDPPSPRMTVDELNKFVQSQGKFERGKKHFRSSFIPRDLAHSPLEDYLERERYELYDKESQYIINCKQKGQSKFDYNIALDGDLKFVEVRYPDVKWVFFTIKRCESEKRDVRMTVQSFRHVQGEDDPATRRYRHADVIRLDGDEVMVQPEFIKECSFVRRKVTSKYKRPQGAAEVHLVRSQENFRPDDRGRFTERSSWREEVVVEHDALDLSNKAALGNFPLEFLKYCLALEEVADKARCSPCSY